MTNLTTNTASILRPEQVGPLIIEPVTKESTALQVSTVVHTTSHDYRIPVLSGDPAGAWTAEGAEIVVDDADFDEVNVTPKKLAALTVISNELASDSSPEASAIISQRLVNSLKRSIDKAWFAAATTNGPSGLGSIAPSEVYAGATSYADLDPFLEAQAVAEDQGVAVTSWVTTPQTALELAELKESETSNRGLLQPDATSATGRTVAGVPLYVSPDAPNDGTVYGIKPVVFAVIRKDTEVVLDSSAFFTSDRVAIRAIVRIGFGFPFEGAVVRVHRTAHP